MAEYLKNDPQQVALNQPVIFGSSIPCPKGYVYHEDETGILILRGITPNCFARYQLSYGANIAIPTGGAVTPIALSLTVSGESRPTSKAIFTPAAVETFGNVSGTAIITVPKGCCFTVALRYVPASDDPTVTPTPVITVQNANLTVTRIA